MTERDRILLRRSKMLAAALAVGLPACGSPRVCLFCAPPSCNGTAEDASDEDAAMLSETGTTDASTDAKTDASTDSGSDSADARDGD